MEKLEKITIIVDPSMWIAGKDETYLCCSFEMYPIIKQKLHEHFNIVERQVDLKCYPMTPNTMIFREEELKNKSLIKRLCERWKK